MHARPPSQAIKELRFYAGLLSLFVVHVALFLLVAAVALPVVAGWVASVISSHSMAPTIARGDIVVGPPHDGAQLGVGTVITFRNHNGTRVTHRIAGLREGGAYSTRGDANRVRDPALVSPADIESAGRLLVPLIGHPIVWRQEGAWCLLGWFSTGMVAAVWASRWATNPRFDPWRDHDPVVIAGHGRHRRPRTWHDTLGIWAVGTHRRRRWARA